MERGCAAAPVPPGVNPPTSPPSPPAHTADVGRDGSIASPSPARWTPVVLSSPAPSPTLAPAWLGATTSPTGSTGVAGKLQQGKHAEVGYRGVTVRVTSHLDRETRVWS